MDKSAELDYRSLLKHQTQKPGVYRMINNRGKVIYVGKAKNLKKRLASYFTASRNQSPKTRVMMQQVRNIEVTVTHTENEALILENNLIKDLRPRYNVWFRDDKSYPYIYLSSQKEFPRLTYYRGARNKKGRFFGPYPGAGAAKKTINLVEKLFRIRSCTDSFFANRTRPCLQYQIKRCTAPCVGYISAGDYRKDVEHAVMFLEGKNEEVIHALTEPMQAAADRLDFETAARYRDQISNLRKVQERQYVSSSSGEIDIIACVCRHAVACVQVLFVRGGLNLGSQSFFPSRVKGASEADIIDAFLPQFYLDNRSGRSLPNTVLLSHATESVDWLAAVLTEKAGRKVEIKHRMRGERAKWLQMARENAELVIQQHLASHDSRQHRMTDLQQVLKLEEPVERIECFDISHTRGEATVASCVVFGKEGPISSDYRRFNIRDITPGDDYAAIQQVIERRYLRVKKEEGKLPDLILIDGGKGQVNMACGVLEELQLTDIALVGVAKGPDRKAGQEKLIIALENKTVRLSPDSPALHLIQQVRDEAHRFAITGHRQQRKKKHNRSSLEDIEGVGSKRRQNLIRYFGGLQGVASAGLEDLAMVPGINRNLARIIYDTFHENG